MVLDESQKDDVRTFALDREAVKGVKRHDINAMKVRPVIVKDLTIFGTPRSQRKVRSRSRRRKSVKAFDENLNLANSEYNDIVSIKTLKTPKSARSARSYRSIRSAKSGRSQKMSMPKLKQSKTKKRRKSVKKRPTSYDSDEAIERLYNPTKFKRIKENDLKTQIKDKSAKLKRLSEQRKRNTDLLKQYRQFVIQKFGKEKGQRIKHLSNDDDKWASPSDFTQL